MPLSELFLDSSCKVRVKVLGVGSLQCVPYPQTKARRLESAGLQCTGLRAFALDFIIGFSRMRPTEVEFF